MSKALQPYVTSGIALVGAGMIAISPVAPPQDAGVRAVQLAASPYADLVSDTVANAEHIINGADWSAITQAIGDLFTHPQAVIEALTNLTPELTTDLTSTPAQIAVEFPPALGMGFGALGAIGAVLAELNRITPDLFSGDTTALLNAPAELANAYLNGTENISLLGGLINIPFLNGILTPDQDFHVDLDLLKLLDLLGVGDTSLSDLLNELGLGDVSALLDQLLNPDLTLTDLLGDLGVALNDGLGALLGDPTLSELLGDLGLGNLGLGSLSLTGLLSGLGLDMNVDLNSLSLDSVLSAFGLDPTADVGLGSFLDGVGLGGLLDTNLGSLLGGLPSGLLDSITSALNSTIGGLINAIPGIGSLLNTILGAVVLTPEKVIDALNNVTIGDLLGGQTLSATLADILQALGISDATPDGLTIGGLLQDLGFSSTTGDLTLNDLLGDLGGGLLGLHVGDLLDSLSLGGLLNDLGLSDLAVDLSDALNGLNLDELLNNLGDLTHLTLDDLLGDLGLNNLGLVDISAGSFGGVITQLFDDVPQQIIAAVGG